MFRAWPNLDCAKVAVILIILTSYKFELSASQSLNESQAFEPSNNKAMKYEIIDISSNSSELLKFRQIFNPNGSQSLPWPFRPPPPEAWMNTPDLIRHYGFPAENHTIITDDGYILTIFRIPHGKSWNASNSSNSVQKEPVLFTHGLLASSDDWLFRLNPMENLPMMMSEMGYDVWLGNVRGNNYCNTHVAFNTSDEAHESEFWKFNVDDMGVYDAPAMINHILKTTGQSQLSYIGHSMGCSMFFIAMDTYPQLQSKIKKMIALAPAVYINHSIAPLRILNLLPAPVFLAFQELVSRGQIFPHHMNRAIHRYGPYLCLGYIPGIPCALLMTFFAGIDVKQLDNTTSSMIYGHAPSLGSARTLVQFQQWMIHGRFEAYDFGLRENLRRYNSLHPKVYDLENIHVPVYIFNGLNDWLVTPIDVQRLVRALPNVKLQELVPYKAFAHLDFVYAKDARNLSYNRIVQFF